MIFLNELTKKNIGKRLNEVLAQKDIKQKELAEHIGVTANTVSYYLSGERCPDIEKLIEIAKYLNVSTDYLLGNSNIKSTDTELISVCNYTGLSEYAVTMLAELKRSADYGHAFYDANGKLLKYEHDDIFETDNILELELISFFLESNCSNFTCALDFGRRYKKELEEWIVRAKDIILEVKGLENIDKETMCDIFDRRTKIMNDEYNAVRCNYFEAIECFKESLNDYVCDLTKTSDELLDMLIGIHPWILSEKLKEEEADGKHN